MSSPSESQQPDRQSENPLQKWIARMRRDCRTPAERLQAYIRSVSDKEAKEILERLLKEVVYPVITGVVSSKMAGEQEGAKDVFGSASLKVCKAITDRRAAHHDPSLEPLKPIENLEAYTASVAKNEFVTWLLGKNPSRLRVASRLRTILTAERFDFAVWRKNLCGFQTWEGNSPANAETLQALESDPQRFLYEGERRRAPLKLPSRISAKDRELISYGEYLSALFIAVGAPIPFANLLKAVYTLCGIPPGEEQVSEDFPAPKTLSIDRDLFAALWEALSALSARQRNALLFHGECQEIAELARLDRIIAPQDLNQQIALEKADVGNLDAVVISAYLEKSGFSQTPVASLLQTGILGDSDFEILWDTLLQDFPAKDYAIAVRLGVLYDSIRSNLRQAGTRKLETALRLRGYGFR